MKFLPALRIALGAVLISLSSAQAQFLPPPNPNGQISSKEYGDDAYSVGLDKSDPVWRMTWDNNNLYVAVEGPKVNQPVILYLDLDPQQFVNGVGSGASTGVAYNGVNGTLPFQADVVINVSSLSREYRIWDRETGTVWKEAVSNFGGYGDNVSKTIREFSIPWTSINPIAGQGRPANFNWMGYAIDPSQEEVFAQAPRTITPGKVGESAYFSRYFTVLNSGAGSSKRAFGPNDFESYSHSDPTITQLGELTVYDFTLNTPGTLTRTGAAAAWNINGNLNVGGGTLTLGGSSANVSVAGNVNVFPEGKFSFLNSSANLFASGNILFSDPKQFDITANVNLTGNSVNRAISGGTYATLTLTGSSSRTTINNSFLTVTNKLDINQGTLDTGPFRVDLGSTGTLTENGGYLLGNVMSKKTISDASPYDFGGIGLKLTSSPNLTDGQQYPGEVIAERITGSFGLASDREWAGSIKTIDRRFALTATNPANTQNAVETTMAFTYKNGGPDELQGNGVGKLILYQSPEVKLYYKPVQGLGEQTRVRNQQDGTSTVTAKGPLVLQGFFSLSDGTVPLPVELISFSGKAEKNGVSLTWATASELQNKGFEIEHSTEQSAWKSIGFVAGNGSSNERHAYSYFDRQASAGNNYYRLRQIDADGKSVYTSPITVQLGAVAFSLSPVPATDVLTLHGLGSGKSIVEIYNARGQRVVSTSIQADAATTLRIGALPAGIYIVRVLGADRKTQTARFIKQ